MIVTVTTVVVLVIGILSLGLALYGGYVSLSVAEGALGDQEEKNTSEQRYYLLGMIAMIVLLARLLVVPIFFWMLQSLVPYCPGAMCAYGVVNVGMPYSTVGVVLKLVLPFVYGFWIVVEIANRRQAIPPITRNLARTFLIALVPLVLLDSSVDVLLVASIRPVYAPCCSSIYDVDPPFSPSTMLGPEFGSIIVLLTVISVAILIGVQWAHSSRRISILTLALAALASVLYLVTLHDTLAPLVLGLPEHHCPYCLFQEFPDTAFFAGLFWVGIAAAGWRAGVELVWDKIQQSNENLQGLSRTLLKLSSAALLFSLVSLVSHILVAI